MRASNLVQLMGYVASDIESKLIGEVMMSKFTVAHNHKTMQGKELVAFIDCQCWRQTADTVSRYWHKGKPILLVGELRQDKWTGPDGKARNKLYVNVDRVEFLLKDRFADAKPDQTGGLGPKMSGEHLPAEPKLIEDPF